MTMDFGTIRELLVGRDPDAVREMYGLADQTRRDHVGDDVHLRGLAEVSNHCRRRCAYCGVHAGRTLPRYRMTRDEVLEAAREAKELGYGTLVMQAGEDPGLTRVMIADTIRAVKEKTGLAVTLSLGERDPDEFAAWREAGADRYLLRFETSDPDLFRRIHPPLAGRGLDGRMAFLRQLRELGYEVGSGVMVGIPGQTWDMLARDILLFRDLDLDMIGIGPYLPHPDTDLVRFPERFPPAPVGEQARADGETTTRVVALARLMQPDANIPATTALALVNRDGGREHALSRGANIIMPNLTPARHRRLYEIYPAKADFTETARAAQATLAKQLAGLGRSIGTGRGDSPNRRKR